MTAAYPLTWPDNWPRSTKRGSSQFRSTLSSAIANVQKSIKMFSEESGHKVENLLISSNVSLMDGSPPDPGVALYFSWDGISTCIAVDRYQKVEDNLQAIHHCIEAERTKLRHGGLNLVRASMRGFAALPPPPKQNMAHWSLILDIGTTRSLADIEKKFRELAHKYHPDKPGGDAAKMAQLNYAIAQARMEKAE